MESLCLLLQGLPDMKGHVGIRVTPRALGPVPAAPRASTQRLMFPMRGFRRHFPFVTPAVTRQVRHAPMFRVCVAMSGISTGSRGYLASCLRRHIAVTLPGSGLEAVCAPTYACFHAIR